MNRPYMIGIWQPSPAAAIELINHHNFGNVVVTMLPDPFSSPTALWIMLKVTSEEKMQIEWFGHNKAKPSWTLLK